LRFKQLAVGLSGAEPFAVQGPQALSVVKGYPVNVPVTVTRGAKQGAFAVEVTGMVPTPNAGAGQPPAAGPFVFKPATAAAAAGTASFTLTPTTLAPEGRAVDLLIQGKATVNKLPITVIGPAVSLTILRPFSVELGTPTLSGKVGQTVVLKGKLKRQDVFKEAVTIGLPMLPPGVALVAAPKPVAANQTDFQIELRLDGKAPAAMTRI